jgi:hypothetical protein
LGHSILEILNNPRKKLPWALTLPINSKLSSHSLHKDHKRMSSPKSIKFPIGFRLSLYEETAKDLKMSEESFQLEREPPTKQQIPKENRGIRNYLI